LVNQVDKESKKNRAIWWIEENRAANSMEAIDPIRVLSSLLGWFPGKWAGYASCAWVLNIDWLVDL